MMKKIFLFCFLVNLTLSHPVNVEDESKATIEYSDYVREDDYYFYKFITSNGIEVAEEGILEEEPGSTYRLIRVSGYYLYNGDDGFVHGVSYYADENGYHPTVWRYPLFDFENIEHKKGQFIQNTDKIKRISKTI